MLHGPFANVRSSVVGLVNALQLPSDSNLFVQLNDDTLSKDQRISVLLDIVTIHCGQKTSVILNLHKTVADLALGRRDAPDGSAAGTKRKLNISKLTEGMSRGVKPYEQGAYYPFWRNALTQSDRCRADVGQTLPSGDMILTSSSEDALIPTAVLSRDRPDSIMCRRRLPRHHRTCSALPRPVTSSQNVHLLPWSAYFHHTTTRQNPCRTDVLTRFDTCLSETDKLTVLRPKLGKSAAKVVEANADVQTASTVLQYLAALEKVFQPRELECSQALSSLDAAGSIPQATGKPFTAVEFLKKAKEIFTRYNCKFPDGKSDVFGLVNTHFPFAMRQYIITQQRLIVAQVATVTMSDLENVCESHDAFLLNQQNHRELNDAISLAPAFSARSRSNMQNVQNVNAAYSQGQNSSYGGEQGCGGRSGGRGRERGFQE